MSQSTSIPHEAVRSFIKRFNKRAVYADSNINCPNVLDPKSRTGQKISSIMKSSYVDKNGDLIIDHEPFQNIGYSDLIIVLQLCYLDFSMMISEKTTTNGFEYITRVYSQVLNMVKNA